MNALISLGQLMFPFEEDILDVLEHSRYLKEKHSVVCQQFTLGTRSTLMKFLLYDIVVIPTIPTHFFLGVVEDQEHGKDITNYTNACGTQTQDFREQNKSLVFGNMKVDQTINALSVYSQWQDVEKLVHAFTGQIPFEIYIFKSLN